MMFLKLFKIPFFRHVLAGFIIVVFIWGFVVAPLKGELKELHKQSDKDRALIEALAKRDTYRIDNTIEHVKAKKGSEINMIPKNEMGTSPIPLPPIIPDTLIEEKATEIKVDKRPKKWWKFWRSE